MSQKWLSQLYYMRTLFKHAKKNTHTHTLTNRVIDRFLIKRPNQMRTNFVVSFKLYWKKFF